jgi:hypothetical protein
MTPVSYYHHHRCIIPHVLIPITPDDLDADASEDSESSGSESNEENSGEGDEDQDRDMNDLCSDYSRNEDQEWLRVSMSPLYVLLREK